RVGGLSAARVAWALTALAEACLGLAWEWAEAQVAVAGTLPDGMTDGEAARPGDPPVLVIGMGKLGGRELDYGSDLDLVVLYAEDRPAGAGGPAAPPPPHPAVRPPLHTPPPPPPPRPALPRGPPLPPA